MRRVLAGLGLCATLAGVAHAQAPTPAAIDRNNRGAAHLKAGRHADAVGELRQAVQLSPGYAIAWANLGFALDQSGQIDEAIAAYRRAIELDGNNVVVRNNLGALLSANGRYDEAAREFDEVLRRDPGNATAKKNLETAQSNRKIGQEREGHIANALRAAESKPDDPRSAYDVARLYAQYGDHDNALTWLGRALSLGYQRLEFIPVDPSFATLKQDPRFNALLRDRGRTN